MMDIEEARALKRKVLDDVVAPLMDSHIKSASLSFAATEMSNTTSGQPRRVMAIGISKIKQGYGLAVRLQRRSLLDRPELDRLKKLSAGELDIRFVGRIEKRATPWYQEAQRPLLMGCSVAHQDVTAGTLGAFVRRKSDAEALFVLSNNHVLANENKGKEGDLILQPGRYDGGKKKDAVAKLADFIKLKKRNNLVDCAIASIDYKQEVDLKKLKGIGKLSGVNPNVDIDMVVRKIGRTTGLTRGIVTAIELDDVVVAFGTGNISFNSQIEIEAIGDKPFSDGGDSGSLIVDEERRALALLFAGSDSGGVE